MAVIDMPLDELKKYSGKNPCPDDFDLFWQNGLHEVNALSPQPRLKTADFACSFADCYDLYFTGVKNAQIYAKVLKPRNKMNCPALLCFHGYSASSSEWVDYLAYAAQGYVVVAMDCRGQGGQSQDTTQTNGTTYHGHIIRGLFDGPENLLFRHVFLDTVTLARIVMEMDEVDNSRVITMGRSQGGALALACASLVPQIKNVAAAYPFLCDYQRVWELDLCPEAYIELRNYFRRFDPRHDQKEEIFIRLGYIDIQHLAKWVQANVMVAVGLRDDICPPSSQFAVYNKLTCPRQMIVYPDFGHEPLPGFADLAFKWMIDQC